MIGLFKKDDYIFGAIIGVVFPVISAFIIYITLQLLNSDVEQYIKVFLLSIVINILLIRYYLQTLKYEKTGKAILFVTFILLIAFFIYYFKQ